MFYKKYITNFILMLFSLVLFCPTFVKPSENIKSMKDYVRDNIPSNKPISGPPNPPYGE